MIGAEDLAAVAAQLGRSPRASRAVAHRCSCGLPDVVETSPRLEDGTPFPTLYYLTCPRAASAIGRVEASGVMREMTERLATDPDLAARYQAAYDDYLARRDAIEPLETRVAAGGMPNRVKCLHVHVAHALAAGPGVNPFGDEVLAQLDDWGADGRCVTPPMRVAAIDCGTNSIRLLVADVDGGRLADVVRRMEIVRLGEGVDRTGRFGDAALVRTFAALDDYAAQIRELGAERVRMVATSATRDAANRDVFVSGVRERLGVDPDVVSGDEEAALSFAGATGDLSATNVAAPYLVCDIGGGSTEFVLGDAGGVRASRSVDIGCVRMTERHLHDDPPTAAQIAEARADIESALDEVAETVPVGEAASLIGLAGSVTTVTALALELEAYDPERIHHARISAADVHEVAESLLAMKHAARAALPVMHPGRVDVIGAGALVLDTIVRRGGFAEVVASEHDILDGIALSLMPDA